VTQAWNLFASDEDFTDGPTPELLKQFETRFGPLERDERHPKPGAPVGPLPSGAESGSSGSSLSTGAIAGIAVAGAALVGGAAAATAIYVRNKARNSDGVDA
jgi:hypothetical protein